MQTFWRHITLVGLATLSLTLSACKDVEEVNKRLDAFNARLEAATKVTETLGEKAIRAVPGARLGQLMDGLYGEDEAEREKARNFLRRMGGIEAKESYDVSVWVGYDERNGPLNVAIFKAPSNVREEIQRQVTSTSIHPAPVRSALYSPLTDGQIDQAVTQHLDNALDIFFGEARILASYDTHDGRPSSDLRIDTTWPYGVYSAASEKKHCTAQTCVYERTNPSFAHAQDEVRKKVHARRAKGREELKQAMLAPYSKRSTSLDTFKAFPKDTPREIYSARLPWGVMDPNQYVFIVMYEEDWTRHKDNLQVFAKVHEVGDPQSGLNYSPGASFSAADFSPDLHDPVRLTGKPGTPNLVWTVANLTGANPVSLAMIEDIKEIRSLLKQVEALKKP